MGEERRTCPRQEALFGATLVKQSDQGNLLVMDLSQRGCKGATEIPLSQGERVALKIPVNDEPAIIILGTAQWTRPVENTSKHVVGIEFHTFPQVRDSERLMLRLRQLEEEKARRRAETNEFQRLRKIDQETGRQMSALVKLNRKLSSSHKLEDVMESLLDVVTSVIPSEKALVMLDHGGPVPEIAASRGIASAQSERLFSRELVQQVLGHGLPVLSLDVLEDAFLADNQSLCLMGTRSILCVPLTSGDKTLGVLYLDSSMETGIFGYGDQELARVIAELAAGAIERARYMGMLIQSEKMSALGTLLAGIAHELNGPLTTVIGVAELIDDPEIANMLRQQGTRCRDLVLRLTHLAHPWDAKPRPVDLADVVQSTLPLLKAELTRRKVRLTTTLAPDLPYVLGDEGTMSQVLLNLIQNAMHALQGQAERQIHLEIQGSEGQVVLAVSDTGPGIPPASLSRIFDPYFTTKARGEGTGLGLALTRTIVEQHGGTIEASNSASGGAVFRAVLPSSMGIAKQLASKSATFTN